MYRAMGQDMPHIKHILELNPTHPLVSTLQKAYDERKDDTRMAETAEMLYGMALLAEGGELSDQSRFIRLLADRLERTLRNREIGRFPMATGAEVPRGRPEYARKGPGLFECSVRSGRSQDNRLAAVRDQALCAARPEAGPTVITGTITGRHAGSAELTSR